MIQIRLDVETRSACPIERGAHAYSTDLSTRVQCLVAKVGGDTWVLCSYDCEAPKGIYPPPPEIQAALDVGAEVTAFNVGFEQSIWRNVLGWPEPARWSCTMALCAVNGLPQSLDGAAKYFGLDGKHEAGMKIMKKTCAPLKDGSFYQPTAEEKATLLAYCRHDVELEAEVDRLAGEFPAVERPVWEADNAINMRGVYVDRKLCTAAGQIVARLGDICDAEVCAATGGAVTGDDLTRLVWLLAWCNDRLGDAPLKAMDGAAISAALRRKQLPADVRTVLECRRKVARISVTKLIGMLEGTTDADPRLRGQFRYCAAGPGRWKSRGDETFYGRTGDGVQLQNLPKPQIPTAAIPQAIAATLRQDLSALVVSGGGEVDNALVSLVRPAVMAKAGHMLAIVDYASIEARGALWLAGDYKHLKWFIDADNKIGLDPYCVMAGKTFGRTITKADKNERQLGKVQMLACQYGMGEERFIAAAIAPPYNIDPAFAQELGPKAIADYREEMTSLTGGWAKGRPKGFWALLEWSARTAYQNQERVECGPLVFGPGKFGDLAMRLPSGRIIRYHKPRMEAGKFGKDQFAYTNLRDKRNESMYGGKWLENATQAICRDLMAHAMVALTAAGFDIVMHCHDEIVCEVPCGTAEVDLKRVEQIMLTVPPWAKGFPINVEGFISSRYGKEKYLGD